MGMAAHELALVPLAKAVFADACGQLHRDAPSSGMVTQVGNSLQAPVGCARLRSVGGQAVTDADAHRHGQPRAQSGWRNVTFCCAKATFLAAWQSGGRLCLPPGPLSTRALQSSFGHKAGMSSRA
jgi:hypothetical protein